MGVEQKHLEEKSKDKEFDEWKDQRELAAKITENIEKKKPKIPECSKARTVQRIPIAMTEALLLETQTVDPATFRCCCLSRSYPLKMPKSKEPCSQEACDIQTCLTKNNFVTERCFAVIEALQICCEKCDSRSTHCASLSGLLAQRKKS
ncbi:hypothetical protein L7F22_001039 [Adiantum nelumboides]|nr:hypothetical protein [Adiantum nelumboides]